MKKALSLLVVFALLQYSCGQLAMLELIADPAIIGEGNVGTQIIINLVSGDRPVYPVVIAFTTSGTATAGADYEAPGDFTYTPFGRDDQMFALEIIEDSIAEYIETIILTASVLSGPAQFSTDNATIHITHNDEPFRLSTEDVNEDDGSAVVVVELRATEIAFDVEVAVVTTDPASSPSPATAGDDYAVTIVVLTFMSGASIGETQNFNIPIVDDNLVERTEVFDVHACVQLLVSGTTQPTLLVIATGTIVIFDNDVAIFELFPLTSDVNEASGPASVSVRLAASSGELTFDIDVTIETTGGGTATATDDYTAATVIRTFTSGNSSGSPAQSLDIPIINDDVDEPTETIFVQGSASDASAQFSNDTATVNIIHTVSDMNQCGSIGECHPNATCIHRSGGYACVCNVGFTGDGFTCQQIQEDE